MSTRTIVGAGISRWESSCRAASGESKRTLPTSSRLTIYKMYAVQRLSFAEISRRTGVGPAMVRAICRGGRLIDSARHIRGETSAATDIPSLLRRIDELQAQVCPEKTDWLDRRKLTRQ